MHRFKLRAHTDGRTITTAICLCVLLFLSGCSWVNEKMCNDPDPSNCRSMLYTGPVTGNFWHDGQAQWVSSGTCQNVSSTQSKKCKSTPGTCGGVNCVNHITSAGLCYCGCAP